MVMYKMINWQTFPFRKRSFKGQLERYAKCCIVNVDNPNKVLDIIPLFGFEQLIKKVYNIELGIDKEEWLKKLEEPVDGEFVEIESQNGPLFHRYTKDEALYGLCTEQDVGRAERLNTGKVKIYHSIKVFTLSHLDKNTSERQYINGWYPDQMYYKYMGYRYIPLSDLTEPLQL